MNGTRVISKRWLRRMGIIIALLFAGIIGLLPAAPVRGFGAGNISFPNFPTTAASGTQFGFSILVSIPQYEYVPIGGVTLYMFRADNRAASQATASGLPLGTFSRFYSEAETAGGRTAVYATADNKWIVVSGSGYGPGPTSIKYDVIWDIPVEWRAGPGQVEVRVATSNTTSYLQTASFAITVPAPVGGTYVPSQSMNGAGVFTQSFTASSIDGRARLNINQDTKGLIHGELLSEIDIIRLMMPPPPPAQTRIVDRSYTFGPEGTIFDSPVTISIAYDPSGVPAGTDEKNLYIGTWNAATGGWESLNSNVDPLNHVVTAQVTHFSLFSPMASTRPADFAVSNLTITPDSVEIGKPVIIGVTVTNTGDFSGEHRVTIKLDGVPAASEDVTLAGKTSQKVMFSASGGTVKTYAVDISGLTGTFTVKPATQPPPPLAPTAKPTDAPTTPPATGTATPKSPTPTATPKPAPTAAPSPTSTASPSPGLTPSSEPLPAPISSPGIDWWPVLRVFIPIAVLFLLGLWLVISSLRQR